MKRGFYVFAVLLAFAALCLAQNPYGRIGGRVTDPAGLVAPGVTVTATNVATNVIASTVTNDRGNFEFLNLNPGSYMIRSELAGFKRYERGPLTLQLGSALEINIAMEVGQITQSVTVSAEAPLLESSNATMGQTMDNRRIESLPLPANNVLYLGNMAAGMSSFASPNYEFVPYSGWGNTSAVIAGTPQGSTEFSIDGAPNNIGGGGVAVNPPPEMIQEFRVTVAPFDASVGNFAGGSMNMVLKSGTNAFHGNLHFTHQSRPLVTRHLYTNGYIYDPSSGPVTPEKIKFAFPFSIMNRYTAQLDGPVYIPKVYDGRNKTFFTWGWDRLDRVRPEQAYFTVPTAKERQGDFSDLLALGSQYQLYNPFTTAYNSSTGRYVRQPFVGNVIPPSLLSPMAQKLLSYYPMPNVTAKSVDGQQNFFDPKPRNVSYWAMFARVDHNFSQRHRLYGSYNHVYQREQSGDWTHTAASGTNSPNSVRNNLTLDDVYTFSPATILNIRYSVNRQFSKSSPKFGTVDLLALGFPASLVSRLDTNLTTFPSLSIDNYAALGGNNISNSGNMQQYIAANASHMRGNHGIRFGAEMRILNVNSFSPGQVSPSLSFSTTYTKLNDTSSAPQMAGGLASFLVGVPTGGSKAINDTSARLGRYLGFYVHDDWKVNSRLTLNIGLRWEIELPLTERYNRYTRGFDLTVANPISATALANYTKAPIPEVPVSQFKTLGGFLFAGVNGVPSKLWNTQLHDFNPRFGFAYKVGDKTVVRGGYGVYYQQNYDILSINQAGFSQSTSLTASPDNGITYIATLANPFPGPFLQPVGSSKGYLQNLGQSISVQDPDQNAGYMQRWSMSVQRELPHRWLIDLGYMGNRATGLSLSQDYSAVPSQYLSTSPVRDQATIDYLGTKVTNPFYGMTEFAGTSLGTNQKVSKSSLLVAYPHFSGVSAANYLKGISWYHSMLLSLEKRFSSMYSVNVSYTWSKFMQKSSKLNSTDVLPQAQLASDDHPHRWSGSALIELPFGRGRKLMSTAPGWLDAFLGGWQMNGMYQYQTGNLISWGNIIFYGKDFNDVYLPRSQRTIDRYFNTDAGFEKSSSKQLSNNIRNFPQRWNKLRGRGYNSVDMSVSKNFRLHEGTKLEVRADAQNLCNRAELGSLTTSPTSTLFGSYFQDASNVGLTEQRRVTVGLKLAW